MVNIIVITHGEFGAYLVEAAESIVGRQAEGVRVVSISPRLSVADLRRRIEGAMEQVIGEGGVLALIDMPGGTPGNLSFPVIKDRTDVEMLSGVNLYMLISAFSHRASLSLRALADKVMADGRKSILDVRKLFFLGAR